MNWLDAMRAAEAKLKDRNTRTIGVLSDFVGLVEHAGDSLLYVVEHGVCPNCGGENPQVDPEASDGILCADLFHMARNRLSEEVRV